MIIKQIKESDISKIYELSNETFSGMKDTWANENHKNLMYEFLDDNAEEFNIFLEDVIIDEERDVEYWTEVFCKEEMAEEFNDFVDCSYNEYEDVRGVK
jgi:bifunctional DNase/RNase